MTEPQYPTLEKMQSVQAESQIIGQFLDHLQNEMKVRLMVYNDFGGLGWVHYNKSIEQILADYFKIDLKQADAEKQQVIQSLRLKPSNFVTFPYSSVFAHSEHETVAVNIMVILKRTGDKFRELSLDEYKTERNKDREKFTEREGLFFQDVVSYCTSADKAKLFSPVWKEVEI